MQLVSLKIAAAIAWVLAVCIAGVTGHVNTLSSWTALAALALVPPVLIWRWNASRQTMSESIQDALR